MLTTPGKVPRHWVQGLVYTRLSQQPSFLTVMRMFSLDKCLSDAYCMQILLQAYGG